MPSKDRKSQDGRRVRIRDIALEARVSTATVDRVVNERPGVRAQTVEAVRNAIEYLQTGDERKSADTDGFTFDVVLPWAVGPSTDIFQNELLDVASRQGVALRPHRIEALNPSKLADALRGCAGMESSGVAFQALDHPLVNSAAEELVRKGIPTLTLLSDLGGARRDGYVGMDNRAAGRTAGLMMGRFLHGTGKVAVLWASPLYQAHGDREFGFRSLLRAEFPGVRVLDQIAGHDDPEESYQRLSSVLREQADIVGVYNVGAGTPGVVRAIREAGGDIVLIGHNLTDEIRHYLTDGVMSAVIHQDLRAAAEQTVSALIKLGKGEDCIIPALAARIMLRDNMPS